jgi:hypothetical protein
MENSEHIILSIKEEYDDWLDLKEESLDWKEDSLDWKEDSLDLKEESPPDIEMGIEHQQIANLNLLKRNINMLTTIYLTEHIRLVRTNISMILCIMMMNNML